MRNDIGYRIKFHRERRNMTQGELAEGIISVSYLSKIENGRADAPEEVIDFLCKKLDIKLNSNDGKKIESICKDWFEALFNQNLEKAHALYKEIEKNKESITSNSLLNLVEIHILRYFLIHNKQREANLHYKKLRRLSKQFNEKESYYWLKFNGYYWFSLSSYNKALIYFQKAERYLHFTFYEIDEEEYSLYYMIALTASYDKKARIVYEYASKALQYYERKVKLKQAAECHLLLGITFVRNKDFEDAIESFTLAQKIADTIDNKDLLATSLQNIGNLYSILNKSKEAIAYYKQSYELRNTTQSKIVPINSLMIEYYKTQDIKKASYWLETGQRVLSEDNTPSIYRYELEVYNQLINGIVEKQLEKLVLNEVIPFLDNRGQQHEKVPFLELLANYYFDNRKYKLAAIYYNQALKIKSNL
ncbi:helix-turn-helix domain-containing protein [Oceanobacillus luteolus]|uniref:Tetratricopeptide repeat protein n=1 Tax=Oceanobacillus luteolus TaxID=1274358 RepID=A0ABW4HVU0_9BACI